MSHSSESLISLLAWACTKRIRRLNFPGAASRLQSAGHELFYQSYRVLLEAANAVQNDPAPDAKQLTDQRGKAFDYGARHEAAEDHLRIRMKLWVAAMATSRPNQSGTADTSA